MFFLFKSRKPCFKFHEFCVVKFSHFHCKNVKNNLFMLKGEFKETKTVKMITANVFGSPCRNKPWTQRHISSDLFGSCLSFRGCKTSLREPPREPTVGLDTWESHPGFIITLYNTQQAMSGSAQFKVKVMETISPPSRRDVAWRSKGGGGGGGLIVVKARPWEEEHGKILEMKHIHPQRWQAN